LTSVRLETAGDEESIREVVTAAFGQPDEADLVDRLRYEGAVLLSAVAEGEGRVTGHILFSRMHIETADNLVAAAALAPVAVLPEFQRQSIGSRLIRYGLDVLRERGEEIIIVLGHPDYYPQFGFSVEKAATLTSPFPKDAYMALELRQGALEGIEGTVRYPSAFGL
jgi:putative acetyltransferase